MSTETTHHRINEQLQHYWEQLRGNRPMPYESDINIADLKEIWDYCFLVNVNGERFAYSYLGPQLIEMYGDDFTGKEIAQTLLESHPHSLFSSFKDVVANPQPKIDENEFTNSRGQLIKYRSCILPLGSRGHLSVGFLLGGMKWKAY